MDDWDEFDDFIPAAPSSQNVTKSNKQENVSSRPTSSSSRPTSSSSSTAKGKRRTDGGTDNRPKSSPKEKDSSEDWADDETSWNGKTTAKSPSPRPSSSSTKSKSAGNRPKTSAEVKDPSADWGDDEADVRPRSSGNSAPERTAKSPKPSPAKAQENGWLDDTLSQSTVDILKEADMWLADDPPPPSRSGSAADKKGPGGSGGSSVAGSRAELKSRQSSRAGSRPSSRSRSRTSLRPDSARSRALSPRPNRIAPAEVHVVDERPDLARRSPSSSPRDAQPYRPGSQDGRSSSRSSRRPSDATATSNPGKKGLMERVVDTLGGKTSVLSMRAAAPGESVSNPRTPSKNSGRRPSTGMSGMSAVSSSSGCSSASQRSEQAEVHFEAPLEKRFECPVCRQVLRFPVEFQECGHHVCSQCIPELVRTSGACPIDNKTISRDQAYPNKSLQLEIAALAVRCPHAVRGCTWRGRYDEHQSHDESCDHATEPCPNGCGAEVQKRFLQSHVSNDCPKRGTACDFCGQNVQQEDEIEHLKVCPKFPMSCPNGCDAKELPREELVYHSARECPKAVIDCPFAGVGCAFEAKREHMPVHQEARFTDHLELTVGMVMANDRRLASQHGMLVDSSLTLEAMQGNVGSMDKVNGCQLLWKITSYNEKFADAKAGRRVSLYSPMFLTSRYGYKMAISICPNGDGQGKGKYMSMFMCIIRGEFDALLPWPFAQKVTITVIDQCQDPAARKNILYVMKPNTCKDNIQFLGRPTHERNPSFGTQMFCPLSQLHRGDYIRDNTMFISVQVDNTNMPSIP
ncbi:PREDICTED: TNF receptor-associated factor 6-like [Branchiostoma belcheri]|uniref:TNF receptor-associated factor 6-like n=1 Tax=Branchiostoma belcheri TaxID=7741 RepID=A0A6P4Y0H7_BRABE|nr:PREDICTED: TNF receptor-associated factor 6-like [Branchiostoma belcheri]